MKNVLKKFKCLEINKEQLKEVFGEDLYNVSDIKTEKVYADDVPFPEK